MRLLDAFCRPRSAAGWLVLAAFLLLACAGREGETWNSVGVEPANASGMFTASTTAGGAKHVVCPSLNLLADEPKPKEIVYELKGKMNADGSMSFLWDTKDVPDRRLQMERLTNVYRQLLKKIEAWIERICGPVPF